TGPHGKRGASKMDLADQFGDDIARFKRDKGVDRMVAVWCGSTEVYRKPAEVHASLERFERGLRESDPEISPSQIYAYACLKAGVPVADGAPNLTVDLPAVQELGAENAGPVGGQGS